jgi:hypothetical protein
MNLNAHTEIDYIYVKIFMFVNRETWYIQVMTRNIIFDEWEQCIYSATRKRNWSILKENAGYYTDTVTWINFVFLFWNWNPG